MGSTCSQPTAVQPAQEILVLVEQINMVSGHSNREMLLLKRMLSRNSTQLKKRIEDYKEKLKDADPDSPVSIVWRTEKERAEELMKKLLRMQLPLAYMA
jgi:hypothetical protein